MYKRMAPKSEGLEGGNADRTELPHINNRTGKINKFDFLMSSKIPGVATSISTGVTRSNYRDNLQNFRNYSFARALQSYDSTDVGSIEVMLVKM